MNVVVVAPRISESARALSSALQENNINAVYRRVNNGGRYRTQSNTRFHINWGSARNIPETREIVNYRGNPTVLNQPEAVNRVADKRQFFERMRDQNARSIITSTESYPLARQWVQQGHRVYCRTSLRGNSGEGIVVARTQAELVEAPLYTLGVDTHHEFRIHVLNGVVIDGVRKAFRSDVPEEERNRDIMNHAAGTIFVRSGPALESASQNVSMLEDCSNAIRLSGLDFGAVDVIVDREGNHHILEINTACGLEGTTLERYKRAFTQHLNGQVITPWSFNEFANQSEETTAMNMSQARIGSPVRYNGNASTLTNGNTYNIERLSMSANRIYVRNNAGRLAAYAVSSFSVARNGVASTAPTVTAPADGSVDTSFPTDSPQRAVRLSDGTSVNVGGSAQLNFDSNVFTRGSRQTVLAIRHAPQSGVTFLRLRSSTGNEHGFMSTHFSHGEIVQPTGSADTSSTPETPRVEARDSRGNRLRNGQQVVVLQQAGGHNLQAGTVAEVVNVTSNTEVEVRAAGANRNTRINPTRIAVMTQRERDEHQRRERARNQHATAEFTVGNRRFRVLDRDIAEVQSVLAPFAV